MTELLTFTTKNGNAYFYDDKMHFFLLIHPELKKVLSADNKEGLNSYYLEKYRYLKKFGFLEEKHIGNFNTEINESVVREGIIQSQQIVFETTDFCNMKCEYCSLGDLYTFSKRKKKSIDTKKSLKFLRYIFDLKPRNTPLSISFFGGEPLLNFEFIKKIIEEVRLLNADKNFKLTFNMTTNAYFVNEYIDFLSDNEIYLLISLDGDEYAHSYRRLKNNSPSFDQVIRNVDMIRDKYPVYFENYISFNSVLHDRNSVKDIYEFIYNRYHKVPMISPLNRTYVNPDRKNFLNTAYHSKSESENEYLESNSNLKYLTHDKLDSYIEAYKLLKNYSINSYYSNVLSFLYDQIKIVPTGTCPPFRRKIFLNTQNQLLPCEKVSYNYYLGNIDDNGNININIHEITERYNSYYKAIKRHCDQCYLARACPICLLSLENLYNINSDNFTCPAFSDAKKFSEKLSRNFSFLEKHPEDCIKLIDDSIID